MTTDKEILCVVANCKEFADVEDPDDYCFKHWQEWRTANERRRRMNRVLFQPKKVEDPADSEG